MVPLSERGHRLYGNEIPEVVGGLRLEVLVEAREDLERMEIAFRALYCLVHRGPRETQIHRVQLGLSGSFS